MLRQTTAAVLLVVCLAVAPAGAALGPTDGHGPAALGSGPPSDTETCSFPVTKTDATGESVTISEDPEEVFVLGPSAAQTMWEIGAQDEVVGVSYGDVSYVDYLPGIEDKTNAGSSYTPSIETIVGEDPDVVLAANIISDDVVKQLRDAGLTVYKFREATSVNFVADKTRDYGEFVGHCEDAEERAERMETQVGIIRSAVSGVEEPTALYLLGEYGYAAGEGTFGNEIVETAGVDNIGDEQGSGYPQLSTEVVLDEDPRWLIRTYEFDTSEYAGTTFEDEDNYIRVDDNYMNQPGPLIVEPMVTIVEAVHPEAYEQARLYELANSGDDNDAPDKWTNVGADGHAVLTAENAPSATSSFEFPSGFEANNSTVHLESLSVTADTSGYTYLTTVGTETVNTGDRVTGERTAAYTLEAGGLTEEQFVNATLEFSVPRTALAAREAGVGDVTVWVSSEISWFRVDTAVVNESAERVRFRATLPREAPFVVTMPPEVETEPTARVNESANGTATGTPEPATATESPSSETTTEPETPTPAAATAAGDGTTTTGSGPGPGLLGSLVALLAAAALLVRRR
jgi:iron complex transport system substrate-binding protein